MKTINRSYQYFLKDIPIKKIYWDKEKLWEISHNEGRAFYHLLYDRLKKGIPLSSEINPPFLIAFSTLNRIFRHIISLFFETHQIYYLYKIINSPSFDKLMKDFVYAYPPKNYHENFNLSQFLSENLSIDLKKIVLYDFIILKIADENPAISPGREFFIDTDLVKNNVFITIIKELEEAGNLITFRDTGLSLFELLKEPIKHSPNSIFAQISYIKERWGYLLPEEIVLEIITTLDIIKEYEMPRLGGRGPQQIMSFKGDEHVEPERFTPDTHWMPRVVLIAKLAYVWLYQLSKKYRRDIKRLDEIPDEELDILKDWGFNALWLIGIWERSPASKKIKHLMGNISAHSSAYSLYDYVIAEELGGEGAFNNLKERALHRNIRLASDMVPNHTGIYSKWIIEHPDWFIQTDYPPFPKYTFTKDNLSQHTDIEIYIEDGYYDKSDASVVFKYHDKRDGKIRYIYHGNDGTSTPWNDTAQLNYLKKEVREAVINTILHVAKKTPIIRFDAAMTLTKRHFQRLWFPMPGQGGSIPSRAEFSLPKEVFDQLMPEEFWREVVDRVGKEAPDTLLLAEAFWLLEGYFVRSLGMHRVYNSAFMNMLRDEENAKYRQIIKNILHFNPEILKRFVNFMSNPDEQTAIEQFGTGDKYLGVCILLLTMPGLPMFAHGQVEGFKEKYGMEFYQSYWDEIPNEYLLDLHKYLIFPLMKKRYLFCESANFYLFDFFTDYGIDEDVYAYSNSYGDEKAVIVYNNRYKNTKGYIKISSEKMVKNQNNIPEYIKKDIFSALELRYDENVYYLFENFRNNNYYLKSSQDLFNEGLYLELYAYECVVLTNIKELKDTDGTLSNIYKNYKNKFFYDFNQLYLETKYANELNELANITYLKYSEIGYVFKILHRVFPDLPKESEEIVDMMLLKIKGIKDFFDDEANYKLINLTVISLYLKSFNRDIFNAFEYMGTIKFLEKKDSTIKLYLSTLKEVLKKERDFNKELFLDFLINNETIANFISLNKYEDSTYFNKERFEELIISLYLLEDNFFTIERVLSLIESAKKSGYSIDLLRKILIPVGRKEVES